MNAKTDISLIVNFSFYIRGIPAIACSCEFLQIVSQNSFNSTNITVSYLPFCIYYNLFDYFHRYCNQVLNREIDECCTELLQHLVRFQDQLYRTKSNMVSICGTVIVFFVLNFKIIIIYEDRRIDRQTDRLAERSERQTIGKTERLASRGSELGPFLFLINALDPNHW